MSIQSDIVQPLSFLVSAIMTSLKTPTYNRITVSHVYKDINKDVPKDTDAFAEYEVEYDDIDRYEVISPVGSGKYSTVFQGRMDKKKECAIKTLKNIPFVKIQREICLLNKVRSIPNVVQLFGVVKDPLTGTISIITDYMNSESPRTLFSKLSLDEIRILTYKLLVSLDGSHQRGIMHRDVKPGNMLFDRNHRDMELIDWGLADLYIPEQAYTCRVSTLRYKAPELLLNYQYYDYGVDVWGAGCVLAEMMIKFPFFEGRDIDEMIVDVASLCGTAAINRYCDKYGIKLSPDVAGNLPQTPNPQWSKIAKNGQIPAHKFDEDGLDLLQQLLTVDHEERISAADALRHKFFDPIRDQVADSTQNGN